MVREGLYEDFVEVIRSRGGVHPYDVCFVLGLLRRQVENGEELS